MLVKQKGILGEKSDPVTDADVIMTAAIIGHSYARLNAKKNCRYDLEVDQVDGSSDFSKIAVHVEVMEKINKALKNGGLNLEGNKKVMIGITPVYNRDGHVVRITGGTGDLDLDDQHRYEPELPEGLSKTLYDLVMEEQGSKLGYQGRGAYTGFIAGRKDGQSALMSTYRLKIPPVPESGRRWIPSEIKSQTMGAEIGEGFGQRRSWGIIGNNAIQGKLYLEGMYMADENKINQDDVVGYIHGMIQAIYDVKLKGGGEPYEIAVGKETTKLASCFPCAIFMEATGFPASSTHLGRGESWCIKYPIGNSQKETSAVKNCNDQWASYCKKIIVLGMECLNKSKKNINATHCNSFDQLQSYLSNFSQYSDEYLYANLVLDAVTIHKPEYQRVDDTLNLS